MSREKPRLRRGDTLCWAHTVALPRTARTEAGEAVDLPEGRRWLGRTLLPWRNSRLAFLYAEEVLDLAGSWEHRAGPEVRPRDARAAGDRGSPPASPAVPSSWSAASSFSQAARRQAFSVLREAWDAELERLLDQGKVYPAVLRAREAWKARHGQDAPAAG
jgi:hypothetical protein